MPKLLDALGAKFGTTPVKKIYRGTSLLAGIENLATNPRCEATSGTAEVWRNLANNPACETASTPVEVRRNLCTRPAPSMGGWLSNNGATHVISLDATVVRRAGVSSRKGYYNGSAGINVSVLSLYAVGTLNNASADRVPVVAGTVYTMSIYMRASFANARYQCSVTYYDAGNVNLGSHSSGTMTTTFAADTWQRVSYTTSAAPAGAVTAFLSFFVYVPSSQSSGALLTDFAWVTDCCFEASTALRGDYFDGGYSPDSDLTSAWVGTASASASTLTGVRATNIGDIGSQSVAFQSTKWSKSGKSARIFPLTTSNASGAAIAGNASGMINGYGVTFAINKTYTILATCRLEAPQTGTIHPNARSIACIGNIGAGNGIQTFTQAPNIAGVHEVRHTFTIPANATSWYIVLYNGASAGNGDVWWDDILIVEGVYTGPYFDGTNYPAERINYYPGTAPVSYGGVVTTEESGYAPGISAHKIVTTAAAYDGLLVQTLSVDPVGVPLRMSVMVKADIGANLRVALRQGGSAAYDVNTFITGTGDWQEVGITSTAIGGLTGQLHVRQVDAISQTYYVALWTWERVSTRLGPPFNGYSGYGYRWKGAVGTSASEKYDPELTPAWVGTANNSVSVLNSTAIAGTSGGYKSAAFSSNQWCSSGTKSIRIISKANNQDSFANINNMLPAPSTLAGKTVTLIATRRLAAPLTGTIGLTRFRISPWRADGSHPDLAITYSTGIPSNTAGAQVVRGTFVVPANATTWDFVRLHHGGDGGSGDVWWDDVMLVEGNYTGPYRDGTFTGWIWSGTADASSSFGLG